MSLLQKTVVKKSQIKKKQKNIQIHIKFSGEPDPEEFEREVTSLQNLQQQPAPSWNPYGGAQGNKTRLRHFLIIAIWLPDNYVHLA